MTARSRRVRWSTVLRFFAAIAILALVASAVDLEGMGTAVRGASLGLTLPALLLSGVQMAAGGLLWMALARTEDPDLTFRQALGTFAGSHAVAIWTPGRAGDFAARPQLMPRGSRRTWAAAVAVEAVFRHPAPLILAAATAGAWVAFPGYRLFMGVALTVGLASLVPCVAPRLFSQVARRLGFEGRFAFVQRISASRRASLVLGHGARYLILAFQFGLLASAMAPGSVPIARLVAAGLVVLAVKLLLPFLSFAELGIREGAAVVVFGAVGVPAEAALNASLLLYSFNVLLPAIPGATVWLGPGRNRPTESVAQDIADPAE